MSIHIITTGGTIDKEYFDQKSAFQVGDPQVGSVLHEANVTAEFTVTALLQKDSLEFTDADRTLIRETIAGSDSRQFIITHGTDTMVATADTLADLPGKTIVLTGSLQPARFRITDAVFNIGCAFTATQILPAGVYITMNGRVFSAGTVRKNVAENRFETT